MKKTIILSCLILSSLGYAADDSKSKRQIVDMLVTFKHLGKAVKLNDFGQPERAEFILRRKGYVNFHDSTELNNYIKQRCNSLRVKASKYTRTLSKEDFYALDKQAEDEFGMECSTY